MGNSSDGPGPSLSEAQSEPRSERKDFDDGANALWYLYDKEAQAHDQVLFQALLEDMSGIPTFAGLFAAVLTSFLVDSLKNLQPDPAQQSVYYHNQSVAILAHISHQLASATSQTPAPPIPSLAPYPDFTPSGPDILVNGFWLIGLVCSLSAALFATLVQQWVRSYMRVYQQYDHPLKRARFRQFFFDGAWSVRGLALSATSAIRFSLVLFFLGLSGSILNVDTHVGAIVTFFICGCGSIFLFTKLVPLWDLQSPDKSVFSWRILSLMRFLVQKIKRHDFRNRSLRDIFTRRGVDAPRERVVMEESDGRRIRDVHAIQWLIDRTAANAEMEPLALAIPGSFNTEWGREVWREVRVSSQAREARDTSEPPTDPSPTGSQVSLIPYPSPPHPLGGATIDTISRCMRNLFESCNNRSLFENEEARHKRMRACVEAAASLVCRIDYQLDWFGEVSKVVSEISHIEKVNSPTTTSDSSFIMRWTCLSLVDIQRILGRRPLRVTLLAGSAVSGLARFQLEHGQPDEMGGEDAQRIDECLKIAWGCAEDLRRAFKPWTQKWTRESRVQVEEILLTHERQISELERMKIEANVMAGVDQKISLYQDEMDGVTHKLTRQLPGVSFDEPHRSESFLIGDAFNTPPTASAPVAPQLIFPGQQLQALARLGLKLREVLDGQVAEGYEEVLESLKSIDQVPVSLRQPNGLIRRQLWRLQDVRDGGGFGYTVELFFLSLRRLLSLSPLHEDFYVSTFKLITSRWMESRESLGTQCILLNIICDLIAEGRGIFSDFAYPESITTMLFNTVKNMLRGYAGPDKHIRDAVHEIESASPIRRDMAKLRHSALTDFPGFRGNPEHHRVRWPEARAFTPLHDCGLGTCWMGQLERPSFSSSQAMIDDRD
ncbi:hypothetical protein EDB86DRAFT_2320202 [Lactarius hatsudake]|nr:hypothetical protein EDB86DRAFT_2320202 [Lactarius hatsudake]